MSKVKPGVECLVVGGALHPSPNMGKRVVVSTYQGEHTLHGPIWRCTGTDLVSDFGVVAIALDFAEDWLQPVGEDTPLHMEKEKMYAS